MDLFQPLVFHPDGPIIELGAVYVGYLVITGINEQDMVIYNRVIEEGASNIAPNQWTPQGGPSTLPIPASSFSGYALDQNDLGVVVGYSIGGGYQPR